MSPWLLVPPVVAAAIVGLALLRDRVGPRLLEHPPEEVHPADVAYLWSAYAGTGSPEPAVRTQLLHLVQDGVLELRTVGSLSDPEDLLVRLREAPMLGPDSEFVSYLFPTGRVGDEVSLRAVGADRSRAKALRSWFMGMRLRTQSAVTSDEDVGLLGLIRTVQGYGDAITGRPLKLGRKLSRPEGVLLVALAVGVQLADRGRIPWLLAVTYASAIAGMLLLPRELPRVLARRLKAWAAFRRYLRGFASLPEAPAAAVLVWERYLVYAVALDVADEVEDQVRRVLPDARVVSMVGGGPLRFLGLGWLSLLTEPLDPAQLAPMTRSLSTLAQRVASRYLGGPHGH